MKSNDKRIRLFGKVIVPFINILNVLLFAASIGWLLLFPLEDFHLSIWQPSENALLAYSRTTNTYGQDELRFFEETYSAIKNIVVHSDDSGMSNTTMSIKQEMQKFILDALEAEGVEVNVQEYECADGFGDCFNVYGIIRSQRADGSESILVSAPLQNQKDQFNSFGVSLAVSMVKMFTKANFFAKDIILVFNDEHAYGMHQFIESYLGFGKKDLDNHAGEIQAGLVLDFSGTNGKYKKLEIIPEGWNGRMANLDLVYVSYLMARDKFVDIGLHEGLLSQFSHDTYTSRLVNILNTMIKQTFVNNRYSHAPLLSYRIDAITIQGVEAEDNEYDITTDTLAKTIESILRCLNNLLERLHQSYFFYFALSLDKFISIGVYYPPFILLIVGCIGKSLCLFYELLELGKDIDVGGDDSAFIKDVPAYSTRKRSFDLGLISLIISMCFTYGISLGIAPYYEFTAKQIIPFFFGGCIIFGTSFTSLFSNYLDHWNKVSLRAVFLLLAAATFLSVSIINFSLAYFALLFYFLLFTIVPDLPSWFPKKLASLMISPPIVLFLWFFFETLSSVGLSLSAELLDLSLMQLVATVAFETLIVNLQNVALGFVQLQWLLWPFIFSLYTPLWMISHAVI